MNDPLFDKVLAAHRDACQRRDAQLARERVKLLRFLIVFSALGYTLIQMMK